MKRTDTCREKLGSGGPCTLMERQHQEPGNSGHLLYITDWGGRFLVYSWPRRPVKLILAGGLHKGAGSGGSDGSKKRKFQLKVSAYTGLVKPVILSPKEGFAIPMSLRHWGSWHGHAHVNCTIHLGFRLLPQYAKGHSEKWSFCPKSYTHLVTGRPRPGSVAQIQSLSNVTASYCGRI